jgi:hypothetical protein
MYFYFTEYFITLVGTQPSTSFTPRTCSMPTSIGSSCNISSTSCDMLRPCQNSATCINTNLTLLGYICSCPSGYSGTECQFDNRPCQPNTCWNNGMYIFSLLNKTARQTYIFLYRYM